MRADVPKAVLVMTEQHFNILRAQLIKGDGLERAVFLLGGRHQGKAGLELYIHRILTPGDGDYRRQGWGVVEPKPEYVLETLSQFAASGAALYLHGHSHPFSSHACFSGIDDRYLPGEITSLNRYLQVVESPRDFLYVRLVWGQAEEGFSAEGYSPDGRLVATVHEIRVVGREGIRIIPSYLSPNGEEGMAVPAARLDRNIRWLGLEGQRKLRKTHLVICGAGGIGSALVAHARGLGFKRITIVDPDVVEPSNLNRLFGARRQDVGRRKVQVMKRQVHELDPDAEVIALAHPVESPEAREALLQGDVIVSGLDNAASRLEVQILAARYLKPYLDLGSGIILDQAKEKVRSMGGQAAFYIPGGPCVVCQGVLDPSKIVSQEHRKVRRALGYIEGTDETPPSAITINSIIAGIGMDLVVKYLTGFAPFPTYLRYDLLSHTTQELAFTKREGCPVCGDEGVEGLGDEETELLKPSHLALVGTEAEDAAGTVK